MARGEEKDSSIFVLHNSADYLIVLLSLSPGGPEGQGFGGGQWSLCPTQQCKLLNPSGLEVPWSGVRKGIVVSFSYTTVHST